MQLRFSPSMLLTILFCHMTANADFDDMILRQRNTDTGIQKEQKVKQADVYSKLESGSLKLDYLPQEKNCFIINSVEINGALQKKSIAAIINNKIAGHCLGGIGLKKVASALQDYYIDAGYITTRVIIPTQDISTGKLILQVNPGRIEKIIVADNDIREWMLPFKINDVLNVRDIEQGLENLQRVPGVNVKINILPGTKNSYSILHIDTNRTKTWSARASYNNWGNKETGRYLTSGVGYLFNAAKLGDLFYIAGTKSTTGQYQNVSGYYSFPVGYWNYTFFYSDSESRQTIPLSYSKVDYAGRSEYWSAKASRMIYRDKTKKIATSAEYIRRKLNYTLNNEDLTLQNRNMGNVKLGINYNQQFTGAYLDSTLSWQRFLNWFASEQTSDMVYGNVSPVSQIFNLEGNYFRQLNSGYYKATLFAQYAPKALTIQDQVSVGDRWSIRGFENSAGLSGRNGFYVQNTLFHPVKFINANYFIGIDYGQVYQDSRYGDETLIGSAVGIEGYLQSLEYNLSISSPLKRPKALEVDKFNLNLNLSYQI